MDFLYTIVDYFEGLLRFAFFILLVVGGIKLMGLAKSDARLEGLKLAGIGLLIWGVTSLLGDALSEVGNWTGMPYSFLTGLLATLYAMLRAFGSGLIDIVAGIMVLIGLSKAAKAMGGQAASAAPRAAAPAAAPAPAPRQ